MKIITGYTGGAHIESADDQALHLGDHIGEALTVLDVGQKFAAEANGVNTVRIHDGAGYLHGVAFRVVAGSYDDVSIASCTSGYKRRDIIAAHYERNTLGVESMRWKVFQGTETTGTPTDPTGLVDGEPYEGDSECDEAAFSVLVDGVNSLTITPLFSIWDPTGGVGERLNQLAGCKIQVGASVIVSVDVPTLAAGEQGAKVTKNISLITGADSFEAVPIDGGRIITNNFTYDSSKVTFYPINTSSAAVTGGSFRFLVSYYKTL